VEVPVLPGGTSAQRLAQQPKSHDGDHEAARRSQPRICRGGSCAGRDRHDQPEYKHTRGVGKRDRGADGESSSRGTRAALAAPDEVESHDRLTVPRSDRVHRADEQGEPDGQHRRT
jgi:hypothetical protein